MKSRGKASDATSLVKLASQQSQSDGFVMCTGAEKLGREGKSSQEPAGGKQIEDLTVQLLLFNEKRKKVRYLLDLDQRVRFVEVDARTLGGTRLLKQFEALVRSEKSCVEVATCGLVT